MKISTNNSSRWELSSIADSNNLYFLEDPISAMGIGVLLNSSCSCAVVGGGACGRESIDSVILDFEVERADEDGRISDGDGGVGGTSSSS